jgi:hypothetical protein
MQQTDARELARTVIRHAGVLGYLVGRGAWWPDEDARQRGRRATAHVMAGAFELLTPVWREHPGLDPSEVRDALGLTNQGTELQDTPQALSGLLNALEEAAVAAAATLLAEYPGAADQVTGAEKELRAAIADARAVLSHEALTELRAVDKGLNLTKGTEEFALRAIFINVPFAG